jgi:alpha-1,4-digalacturonate transport system permease protein
VVLRSFRKTVRWRHGKLATLFDCGNFLDDTCTEDPLLRGGLQHRVLHPLSGRWHCRLRASPALALNRKIRSAAFSQRLFYPVLLSPVVVALVWKWILQRDGLLKPLSSGSGASRCVFTERHLGNVSGIVVSIWAHMGFFTRSSCLAVAVHSKKYTTRAASTGPGLPSFRHLTLPLLTRRCGRAGLGAYPRGAAFDEVFVLTVVGRKRHALIVQYIYMTGFASQIQRFGLAAAASVVLGATLLVLTLYS